MVIYNASYQAKDQQFGSQTDSSKFKLNLTFAELKITATLLQVPVVTLALRGVLLALALTEPLVETVAPTGDGAVAPRAPL